MIRNREAILNALLEDRLKLATVSGILTTRPGLIEWVDKRIPEIELIATKSYQVLPNPGNREPILFEQECGSYGNAVGLRNPGMDEGFRELEQLRRRHSLRALLCVSLSADCIEEFIALVKRFEAAADLLELNFSCPHARGGYGAAIGSRAETVQEFVREIRQNTRALLFPKLTPNVADIAEIALAALEAGADGIAAINTVGPETFLEPHTGQPVLYNPNGHKGGKSGEWIKQIARQKVAEIRGAVGNGVPILGMGGVATGVDALRLMEAGANTVGLGSVFARVPRQELLPGYVRALKSDCLHGTHRASRFLSTKRLMEYRPFSIAGIKTVREDLKVFILDGSMESRASQFAFLFLPGVGEKPFSIARSSPLTFMVRERGEFTCALFRLNPGDTILVRGAYGQDAPDSRKEMAYLVAGGTGLAVVPGLAAKLRRHGKRLTVFYGVNAPEEADALQELRQAIGTEVPCIAAADNGRQGRALEIMAERLQTEDLSQACFYNIGPHGFMAAAMELQELLGALPEEIFACLETLSMCGVGLCGSCECGGRLLCKEGTFVSRQFLRSSGIDLLELDITAKPEAEGFYRRTAGTPAGASRGR